MSFRLRPSKRPGAFEYLTHFPYRGLPRFGGPADRVASSGAASASASTKARRCRAVPSLSRERGRAGGQHSRDVAGRPGVCAIADLAIAGAIARALLGHAETIKRIVDLLSAVIRGLRGRVCNPPADFGYAA